MAAGLRPLRFSLVFENPELLAPRLADDLGGHGSSRNGGLPYNSLVPAQQEHVRELHRFTGVGEFFDGECVAGSNLVLFAAGFNNRKHNSLKRPLEGRLAQYYRNYSASSTTSSLVRRAKIAAAIPIPTIRVMSELPP